MLVIVKENAKSAVLQLINTFLPYDIPFPSSENNKGWSQAPPFVYYS